MNKLFGKIKINAKLKLITGLHIATSDDFAPIGAVDTNVIKDPMTSQPIIPGSSLKGKTRYLLARILSKYDELVDIQKEDERIQRLFGSGASANGKFFTSRLQFFDLSINEKSLEKLDALDLDFSYTEAKFENTINRITGVANPRQLERVPAGTVFDFKLVYNIEKIEEIEEDLDNLVKTLELLENDYLGGHGSRGYGRIEFYDFDISVRNYSDESLNTEKIKSIF